MPRPRFLLGTILLAGSALRGRLVAGVGAMAPGHRKLIAVSEREKIGDEASREEFPGANRWDYLLSVPAHSEIIGVEPHSAKDSEISVVIAKKQHAVAYLRAHLPTGHRVAKWFWVCSGPGGFSRMDRARRRLDQNGVTFEGHFLKSIP